MNQGIVYVICAAGDGTRVRSVNPRLPKPLLKLRGKTLLERSLASLDLYPQDQVVIVGRREHRLRRCEPELVANYPHVVFDWLELDERTSGQLHTAYLSHHLWGKGRSVVIFNADTFFRCRSLTAVQSDEAVQGAIPCRQESGDAWSFCATAGTKYKGEEVAIRVTEKVRIAPWCSVGYYYFRDAPMFLRAAEEALAQRGATESYVAPLYNALIAKGARVVVPQAELFLPMGSIEQFAKYWDADEGQLRQENKQGTIVVDLDNTITIDASASDYPSKAPQQAVVEKLREYDADGYDIIIHTARRMRTMRGNEAKVVADVAYDTVAWLREHNVPFSGLRFGKPYAEGGFYVDDRAVRPGEFLANTSQALERLLQRDQEALAEMKGVKR